MGVQINELSDFSDGIYFIWLIGLIKNIYVPSYNYKEHPESFTDKVNSRII